MCVFGGCDFLEAGIHGFGIMKAHKLMTKYKNNLDRVLSFLKT
jgi:hypothetical protein